MNTSAEQQARDMLERMGIEDAQSFTSGDVVELANLIATRRDRFNYGEVSYGFEVWDGDDLYARGSAATLEDCQSEAEHYVSVISRGNGEARVAYFERREIMEAA
jgi:hypothetical protein